MPVTVDPITREIVQNRLISIVREMSLALQRAAYSPIIYEVKDFSSVLLRPDASVVAQAEGIPIFLGSMHQTLGPVLERYPLAEMREGDVFVSNDPFTANGTHKNDINILQPLFWEGEPVFFAATKAHWTDIGGKDPGSWSPDSTNTYQEGVTVPALRLYRAGELNEELKEVLLASTRLRENNEGDLMAQLSACHTGDVRVQELLARYGIDEVNACIDSLFDYAEGKVRAAIEEIPDGEYFGEDFVDSDGTEGSEPVRVAVTITVKGNSITFDFRDNEPQRMGACGNAHFVNTVAASRVALKCLVGPYLSANEGFYRPLEILTEPGTVTHPVYPAPGTVWDNMGRAIMEAIFFAMAPIVPDRVAAGIFGGVQAMAIAGEDPRTGAPFIHFMPYAGGWGARKSLDGINALCPLLNGDNNNIPCEVTEAKFPLLVERYELVEDSGGAGRTRGGLGIRTDYRVLSEGAMVSAGFARWRFAPPGLFGGGDGFRSTLILDADGETPEERPLVGGVAVAGGALISHRVGGGGGFGPPEDRSRDKVLADLADGYISQSVGASVYGVTADDGAGVGTTDER
jgi:N-methylhydantoinase B